MRNPDPIQIARALVRRHGLRAAAVAQAHAGEQRAGGNLTAFERWHAVMRAVNTLRRDTSVRRLVAH